MLVNQIDDLRQLSLLQDSFQEFRNITVDACKHPLAEYITERVYQTKNPNIRDSERVALMVKSEQEVLRLRRILR